MLKILEADSNEAVTFAGIAERVITPPAGVELAGLGYYLERHWRTVRNDLFARALVVERGVQAGGGSASKTITMTAGGNSAVALVALDLMYCSSELTGAIRTRVHARTGIALQHVCVNVTHSHNTPTAGLIRGAGEVDADYVEWVAEQAADAVADAFERRELAVLSVGESRLQGMTFNRTREDGHVDTRVGVLRVDRADGSPLAAAVNFHSHCTAYMECDLFAVGRDWPGDVVDLLESALPGCTAMYLQGICGDVNFRRDYNGTERCAEPGRAVGKAALEAWGNARIMQSKEIGASTRQAVLPTRSWTNEEIETVRAECDYRLRTRETSGWLEGFARTIVNQPERLPLRYDGSVERAVEAVCQFGLKWSEEAVEKWERRKSGGYSGGDPDGQLGMAINFDFDKTGAAGDVFDNDSDIENENENENEKEVVAEVQGIRIGDLFVATCPGELFTSLGLELRQRWELSANSLMKDSANRLFVLGFANGSIGYIPDAYEIARGSYAALQSPKFTGQQPFTPDAGRVLVDTMLGALHDTATSTSEPLEQ